jgi:hypothetical protein
MSGYSQGMEMSNNAAKAYRKGLKPISKFTTKDLRDCGWTHTLSFARFLAKKNMWKPEEWHHVGRRYKSTNFYDASALIEIWESLDETEKSTLKSQHKNKSIHDGRPVSGHFIENNERVDFTGILKNNTIYFDDGTRKKANGKNVWYTEE